MPVHLTDFGLAKARAAGSAYTQVGEALGTPAYMPPEQARGDAGLGPAADVWSAGCVLYELLAGRPAFDVETPADLIAQVVRGGPPPIRRVRPDIPAGLGDVLRTALAAAPGDRFPAAGALRDDLDRILCGERPRVARSRGAPVAATLLGAAALALVAWRAWPEPPPATPPRPSTPSRAEALAARASSAQAADPAGAVALLGDALALTPDRHAWRLHRGLLLWASGAGTEARAEWEQVPEAASEWPPARFYLGLEAWAREHPEKALARPDLDHAAGAPGRFGALATALRAGLDRDWAAARAPLRGLDGWEAALLEAWIEADGPGGDGARAVRRFTDALAAGLPAAWIWSSRGIARRDLGDLDGAIADLEEAIRRSPADHFARHNRARLLARRGDRAGADAEYEAAVAADRACGACYEEWAELRFDAGDSAGAIALYDAAIARGPRPLLRAQHLNNRGRLRARLGESAAALPDFDAALEVAPTLLDVRFNRALTRIDLGDARGAAADLDTCIAGAPEVTRYRERRGILRLERLGDPRGALEDFDAWLRLSPGSADARFNRGLAKLFGGEKAAAADDLRAAAAAYEQQLGAATSDEARAHLQRWLADCDRWLARVAQPGVPPLPRGH